MFMLFSPISLGSFYVESFAVDFVGDLVALSVVECGGEFCWDADDELSAGELLYADVRHCRLFGDGEEYKYFYTKLYSW